MWVVRWSSGKWGFLFSNGKKDKLTFTTFNVNVNLPRSRFAFGMSLTFIDGCSFFMQFGQTHSAPRCSISVPICFVMLTHFPWNQSSHLSQQIMKRLLCGCRQMHHNLKTHFSSLLFTCYHLAREWKFKIFTEADRLLHCSCRPIHLDHRIHRRHLLTDRVQTLAAKRSSFSSVYRSMLVWPH